MPQLQKDVLIDAPAEIIFTTIADPEQASKLNPHFIIKSYTSSQSGGADWDFEYRFAGLSVAGISSCVEYHRPGRFVMQTKGDLVSRWEWALQPERTRTHVSLQLNYEVPGIIAAIPFGKRLLENHNRQAIDDLMKNLKLTAERRSPAGV
jgi:carbon monoxide dehydrogenase subunit G